MKWLGIPKAQRRDAIVAFFVLFGILTAHSMLETARDALFLASIPASRLPWLYIGIAGLTFAVVAANARVSARFRGRRVLVSTLVLAAVVTAGFWSVAEAGGHASLYAFYLWTGLVATVAVSQFWVLLADRFNVGEAKRTYAFIGAGGLMGATAGAAAASLLLRYMGPRDLLLAAPAVLVLSAAVTGLMSCVDCGRSASEREWRPGATLGTAIDHPYVIRLLVLVAATSVTVTAVDLAFKTVVAETIPAAELGAFFASFYAGLNGLALVVQLVLASRILRALGVNRTLWILPVLLLVSAVGFAASLAIVPLLLMKVFDGSLRHSLNRTGTELLFLPLASALRSRAKVFIDGVGARGGQAVASMGILLLIALDGEPRHLAIGAAVAALAWLALVVGLEKPYLELFRQQLREGIYDTRSTVPELDLHSLEALMSALNSEDEAVVVNALDLLAHSGRERIIPALILYHPSKDVVLRALDVFVAAERTDFLPIARRLMASLDPEIRTAALRAHTSVQPDLGMLSGAIDDSSVLVRTTALVGQVNAGLARRRELEDAAARMLDADPGERIALVRAMRRGGVADFRDVFAKLMAIDDAALRNEIARTIEVHPGPAYVDMLMPLLADRQTRAAARAALVAIGDPALDRLADALAQPSLDPKLRRHVPRSISKFPSAKAGRILLSHLEQEPRGVVGYKILRGLGRMREDDPLLPLDEKAIERVTDLMLRRGLDALAWHHVLESHWSAHPDDATQGARLLALALEENQTQSVERVFRLLNLLHPREDFYLIYQGIGRDPKSRASAEELLEYLVAPPRRDAVLALIADGPAPRRLAAAASFHAPTAPSYRELLVSLLDDESEAVRALAAHHCAEQKMDAVKDRLADMRNDERMIIRSVVNEALEVLSLVPKAPRHAT